jgi:hypothetical protein
LLSVNQQAIGKLQAAAGRRYHPAMSRLFLLFLIVLLPLRGWTSERMGFAMGAGAPRAVLSQAVDTGNSEECALHMQRAAGHHPGDESSASLHQGCHSCQLCMPLAALNAPTVLAAVANPQVLPRARSSRFVSADPVLGVKPPIS